MNMKNRIYFAILIAGLFFIQSCDINELPEFDDQNAFISFRATSALVEENKDNLDIPILLTSLAGLSGTIEFELVPNDAPNAAVAGVNYNLRNESNTLTFTKEEPLQYIRLSIIDNDSFDGDVKLSFVLKNPSAGLNLGLETTCDITISDNEHPLVFILGTLSGNGSSYFNGPTTWSLTFSKDDADLSKVWITNLVPGGSSASTPVYGIVNEDQTEIRIPVKQVVAASASYPAILLDGFYGPDGAIEIEDGGYITGTIAEDGTITLLDEFGSQVYSDADATASLGWYNIFEAGATLKKVE
jgi:hypothetical protein